MTGSLGRFGRSGLSGLSAVLSLGAAFLYSGVPTTLLEGTPAHVRSLLLLGALILAGATSLVLTLRSSTLLAIALCIPSGYHLVWSFIAGLSIGFLLLPASLIGLLTALASQSLSRANLVRSGVAIAVGIVLAAGAYAVFV
jgi:hypothetical protein